MNKDEEQENWKRVQYRMVDEGFHYCFTSYSNWEEIEDVEFHRLRNNYLNSAKQLKDYINKKVEEFDE